MFKAKHGATGQDIISLDPNQPHQQLRDWGHGGLLVCPECSAQVLFRAGGDDARRAHFYHKTRLDCQYGAEDPEILAARAALYLLLKVKVEKVAGGRIDIEVRLPGAPKGDLVDLWLELPQGQQPIAYRILTNGVRPSRLDEMDAATRQAGAIPRYLLTISRRQSDPNADPEVEHPRLWVPAFDRHLIQPRAWDQYHHQSLDPPRYGSLYYIDPRPGRERLLLYREVHQDHDCDPNLHVYAEEHGTALRGALVYRDGELVFPEEARLKGEWERWRTGELERQEQARRVAEEARRAEEQLQELRRQATQRLTEFTKSLRATAREGLWDALAHEGERLLAGRLISVPHPQLYAAPREVWQPRLLAYAYRAEGWFPLQMPASWMRNWVGLAAGKSREVELANMAAFWQGIAASGLARYTQPPGQSLPEIDLLPVPGAFSWPVRRRDATPPYPLAVCIGCQDVTTDWVTIDLTTRTCKCAACFGPDRGTVAEQAAAPQ